MTGKDGGGSEDDTLVGCCLLVVDRIKRRSFRRGRVVSSSPVGPRRLAVPLLRRTIAHHRRDLRGRKPNRVPPPVGRSESFGLGNHTLSPHSLRPCEPPPHLPPAVPRGSEQSIPCLALGSFSFSFSVGLQASRTSSASRVFGGRSARRRRRRASPLRRFRWTAPAKGGRGPQWERTVRRLEDKGEEGHDRKRGRRGFGPHRAALKDPTPAQRAQPQRPAYASDASRRGGGRVSHSVHHPPSLTSDVVATKGPMRGRRERVFRTKTNLSTVED